MTEIIGESLGLIEIGGGVVSMLDSIPDGFLETSGAELSRATYSELFDKIGVIYGDGNGSTTFNLPDSRGQFIRFLDDGAGVDPDAGSRTARPDGVSGDNIGTTQSYELQSHTHAINIRAGTGFGGVLRANTVQSYNINTLSTGGSETRPKNIAFKLLIRAF